MSILENNNLIVRRITKGKLPSLPFVRLKEDILGKSFEASIVFLSPNEAEGLNKTYRQKEYIPNVLSFPLTENSGEVFLSLSTIRKEAKKFGYTYKECTLFMLIHGLLHIKGYDHGEEMEALEEKFFAKYKKLI